MGIVRLCLKGMYHAVSPQGVYCMMKESDTVSYIMYVDNASDTIVKLCGRPDCSHNTSDCNAYIYAGTWLSYYNGYLYAVSGSDSEEECTLIRMNPDGSNRVIVLDLLAFSKENGGDYARCNLLTEGVCLFSVNHWSEVDDGDAAATTIQGKALEYYLYNLDGTMDEPVPQQTGGVIYNCGDVVLSYSLEAKNGSEYGSYWSWDAETDTVAYLTDHPGVPGYFDEKEGYYFKDGAIVRLTYETKTEEVMVDTGLEGDYFLFAFPECIVIASRGLFDCSDDTLYIYNWAFELVDAVKIEYPHSCGLEHLVVAETAERLILSDHTKGFPKYYINKSELGDGNTKIHVFKRA